MRGCFDIWSALSLVYYFLHRDHCTIEAMLSPTRLIARAYRDTNLQRFLMTKRKVDSDSSINLSRIVYLQTSIDISGFSAAHVENISTLHTMLR